MSRLHCVQKRSESCVPIDASITLSCRECQDFACVAIEMANAGYTVTHLKELLRERDLLTTGNKADLILRLQRDAPKTLDEVRLVADVTESTQATEDVSYTQGARIDLSRERTYEEDRELELIRRKRDLLRRKLELVRRESELRNWAAGDPAANDYGGYSIKTLKDLLSEFDGSSGDYWNWERQVELLRDTYRVDDGVLSVLIASKLKEKALRWFHSKPEHIRLSTPDLMSEMKRIFDHRPSKLILKKEFERRTWRAGEIFNEYCHDKVILANRVPIEPTEVVNYIIDGVPNPRLQDQAS